MKVWMSMHNGRLTTWSGVFLLVFIGTAVIVTMWYVFFWVFPHPTLVAVVLFFWGLFITLAWIFYTARCAFEAIDRSGGT